MKTSYVRWQAANARLDVANRIHVDVANHPGRNAERCQLYDVEHCTIHMYTMEDSHSATLFIDTTRFAELTLTKSDFGQLTLDEGVYSLIVLFSDGSIRDYDVTCVKPQKSIFGRVFSQANFELLYRIPAGNYGEEYGVVLQSADQAISHIMAKQ